MKLSFLLSFAISFVLVTPIIAAASSSIECKGKLPDRESVQFSAATTYSANISSGVLFDASSETVLSMNVCKRVLTKSGKQNSKEHVAWTCPQSSDTSGQLLRGIFVELVRGQGSNAEIIKARVKKMYPLPPKVIGELDCIK